MISFWLFELYHPYVAAFGFSVGLVVALASRRSPFPKVREAQKKRHGWLLPLLLNMGLLILVLGVFVSRGLAEWETDWDQWSILGGAAALLAFLMFRFPRAAGIPFALFIVGGAVWFGYSTQGYRSFSHNQEFAVAQWRYLGPLQSRYGWEDAQGNLQLSDQPQWPLQAVRVYPLPGWKRILGGDALVSDPSIPVAPDLLRDTFWMLWETVIPVVEWRVQDFPALRPFTRYGWTLEPGKLTVKPLWP